MAEVKMYNRTTSPIVFKSQSGSFTLAPSNTAGIDGPEYNFMKNVASVMVFSESHKQIKELLDAGDIRVSPCSPDHVP